MKKINHHGNYFSCASLIKESNIKLQDTEDEQHAKRQRLIQQNEVATKHKLDNRRTYKLGFLDESVFRNNEEEVMRRVTAQGGQVQGESWALPKARQTWMPAEDEALRWGVKKYGKEWKEILKRTPGLTKRTVTGLKDRANTLKLI